jgi:sugar/nucleoside kinase (ribokinase family)
MLDAGTIVPRIEELLALADIVIASEKFAGRFTGDADPETAMKKLFSANTKFAAVTLGAKGSIGFDGRKIYRQPALPVETVDTTGAGDVFHGAFAYKYVNGGDWAECLRFAAAVAALKCTKLGGRTGIPTIAETEFFLQEHK